MAKYIIQFLLGFGLIYSVLPLAIFAIVNLQ